MPVRNLTIYDISAYLIPGSVLVLFIYLIPPINENIGAILPSNFGGDAGFVTFFLLLSYVIGTLFQTVLSDKKFDEGISENIRHLSTLPVLRKISDVIKSKNLLPIFDEKPFETEFENNFKKSSRIERDFLKKCESYFGLEYTHRINGEETYIKGRMQELRWLIISHLSGQPVRQTERFLILEIYYRGLWGVFIALFVIYSIYLLSISMSCTILETGCINSVDFGWMLVLTGFFPIGAAIAYIRRCDYRTIYAKSLIRDFYTGVLLQEEQNKDTTTIDEDTVV